MAGDGAVGGRHDGVDLGAGGRRVGAFEGRRDGGVEHRTGAPAIEEQASERRLPGTLGRRPPDLEVVLGSRHGDVQQPQRVAVDLEGGQSLALGGGVTGRLASLLDCLAPRHPRRHVDDAPTVEVEHVRAARRRAFGVGEREEHDRVLESLGGVHRGDVHRLVVGLDPPHRVLGLVVGVGDEAVERLGDPSRLGVGAAQRGDEDLGAGGRGR